MNFFVGWPCKVLQGLTLPQPKNNSGVERNQSIDMYTIDCRIPNCCPFFWTTVLRWPPRWKSDTCTTCFPSFAVSRPRVSEGELRSHENPSMWWGGGRGPKLDDMFACNFGFRVHCWCCDISFMTPENPAGYEIETMKEFSL